MKTLCEVVVCSMTNEIKSLEGTSPEPLARHHCPVCLALTQAPLGQETVFCAACRTCISDEREFIALYGAYVARRLEDQALGDVRCGKRDYAAEDVKISALLRNLEGGR